MVRLSFLTLVLLTPLGSQPTAPRPDPNLNAIVWTQTSAEYGALTAQTYRAAGAALTAALADPHWTAAYEQTNDFRTLPPAVILDLDETVFDNSPSQAKLILDGKSFSEAGWAAWVKEARAGAVPGAVAFLHAARLKGVTPVYISNRLCNPADANDPTILNLKKLRVPFSTDQVLCKTDSSDKTDRRKWAASHYRILLLIGDDFNDFTATPNVVGDRAKLREFYDAMWGTKWFMLPNPAYGSWERAVGFDLADKWKALRP